MPDSRTERTEWIVEAKLPGRQVVLARQAGDAGAVPNEVVKDQAAVRERRLQELFRYLSEELAVKPVLLREAGAVSVSASAEELERISGHPLVRRIEANRKSR